MFRALLHGRLRISAAISGVSLSKSRPSLRFLCSTTYFSSSSDSENDELQKANSFTVSYLVNSCGLSPETAIFASKKVRLRNPKTPDSVLTFLRDHAFSDAQISNFVKKSPHFLSSNPSKTFLPKLEFFYSKGVSKETMAEFLSKSAYILNRSLTKHIVPTFELIKIISVSEKHVLGFMNQQLPLKKYRENVISNVKLLKGLGTRDSKLGSAFMNCPSVLTARPEKFIELVNKVRDIGFDPRTSGFLYALRTFSSQALEKRWRENFKVYKKWGWSESDTLKAYRYFPNCMSYNEERIDKVMDYLVNVMGHPTEEIAKYPVILSYSLEKRTRPRCSVLRVLLKKGLVERDDFKLSSVTQYLEKNFVAKFVTEYEKEVPLLMSVYRGKVDINDA